MSGLSNTPKYQEFHRGLAKEFDISERDVLFFRCCFFNGITDREKVAGRIQKKLPHLKAGGSYRYEPYLNRLSFVSKCTDKQWESLNRLSGLESTNNNN